MGFAVLDETFVRQNLADGICCELMAAALAEEDRKDSVQYQRMALTFPDGNRFGIMPCWNQNYYSVKLIGAYPSNPRRGYSSHQGQIFLFDSRNGRILACLDGGSVTEIRTAAVSAVAASALSVPSSSFCLAIIGCGAQGRSHLKTFLTRFAPERVNLWDRNPQKARHLAAETDRGSAVVCVSESIELAVREADVICTVTASKEPLLHLEWIKPGAHINAVGACSPDSRELCAELVAGCELFCDSIEGLQKESGDYLIPLRERLITDNIIKGTLGQLLNGKITGRSGPKAITVFESLGMAAQDLAAAEYLYEAWVRQDSSKKMQK